MDFSLDFEIKTFAKYAELSFIHHDYWTKCKTFLVVLEYKSLRADSSGAWKKHNTVHKKTITRWWSFAMIFRANTGSERWWCKFVISGPTSKNYFCCASPFLPPPSLSLSEAIKVFAPCLINAARSISNPCLKWAPSNSGRCMREKSIPHTHQNIFYKILRICEQKLTAEIMRARAGGWELF